MRLLGIAVLVVLSVGLTACSQGTENGARSNDREPAAWHGASGTSDATERDTEDNADTWNYVALGDSLAAGVGARQGYADRYAESPSRGHGRPRQGRQPGVLARRAPNCFAPSGTTLRRGGRSAAPRSSRTTSASTIWGRLAAPTRPKPAVGRKASGACTRPWRS